MAGILNWLPAGQKGLLEYHHLGGKLPADARRVNLRKDRLEHRPLRGGESYYLGWEPLTYPDKFLIPRTWDHGGVLTVDASFLMVGHRKLPSLASRPYRARG